MIKEQCLLFFVLVSNIFAAASAVSFAQDRQELHSPMAEEHLAEGDRVFASAFLGIQGAKQPQDFGVNANFGGRAALNLGYLLAPTQGLGVQVGSAIDASANAVQVFEQVEGTSGRTQLFTTVSVFQRSHTGWDWSVGHDFLSQESYDSFLLSQWRMEVGKSIGADRIGVRTMLRGLQDDGEFGNIPVRLNSLNQLQMFASHQTEFGTRLGAWVGLSEKHGERNLALGDMPDTDSVFVWGAELASPLNSRMTLVGQANFITPADTGTVDAFLGIEYVFGGRDQKATTSLSRPLLPVASSPTFSVDLSR